jgi:hypothetical protein
LVAQSEERGIITKRYGTVHLLRRERQCADHAVAVRRKPRRPIKPRVNQRRSNLPQEDLVLAKTRFKHKIRGFCRREPQYMVFFS